MKPAASPSPARENSVNDRTPGCVMAISPSMRITMKTIVPASIYDSRAAGPAAAIAALLPTNRPAPMTPPIVIIVMWRGSSVRLSSWLDACKWGDSGGCAVARTVLRRVGGVKRFASGRDTSPRVLLS